MQGMKKQFELADIQRTKQLDAKINAFNATLNNSQSLYSKLEMQYELNTKLAKQLDAKINNAYPLYLKMEKQFELFDPLLTKQLDAKIDVLTYKLIVRDHQLLEKEA